MKYARLLKINLVLLAALLCFISQSSSFAAAPENKAPSIKEQVFAWELTNARVVSAGIVSDSDAGTLTTDYTIKADAAAVDDAGKIRKGTFRTVFSVFSPKTDMPGQKAGYWYLQGNWSLTDINATDKEKKARHSSSVIKGLVNAVLPFNPLTDTGGMQAQVQLPYSLSGRDGIRGQGTFSGNEQFVGMLNVNADIWPDVIKALEVTK